MNGARFQQILYTDKSDWLRQTSQLIVPTLQLFPDPGQVVPVLESSGEGADAGIDGDVGKPTTGGHRLFVVNDEAENKLERLSPASFSSQ